MVASFSGCKKDRDVSNKTCEELVTAVENAESDYSSNPTLSNCRSYKNALADLKKKDCDDSFYSDDYIDAMIDVLRFQCP